MKINSFGDTELQVSQLGFGCGAVGGLMVLGDHKEMMDAVEYAIDSGINYFDTARMYGDGLSEIHTGAILRELDMTDLLIGTKVRIAGDEFENISKTSSGWQRIFVSGSTRMTLFFCERKHENARGRLFSNASRV